MCEQEQQKILLRQHLKKFYISSKQVAYCYAYEWYERRESVKPKCPIEYIKGKEQYETMCNEIISNDPTCSICLNNMNSKDVVMYYCKKHLTHTECGIDWYLSRDDSLDPICPVC